MSACVSLVSTITNRHNFAPFRSVDDNRTPDNARLRCRSILLNHDNKHGDLNSLRVMSQLPRCTHASQLLPGARARVQDAHRRAVGSRMRMRLKLLARSMNIYASKIICGKMYGTKHGKNRPTWACTPLSVDTIPLCFAICHGLFSEVTSETEERRKGEG